MFIIEKNIILQNPCHGLCPYESKIDGLRVKSIVLAPSIILGQEIAISAMFDHFKWEKFYFFCKPKVNVLNYFIQEYEKYIDDYLCIIFVDENCSKPYSTHLPL